MTAPPLEELRASLEAEARELAARRDRLREQLVEAEQQLQARRDVVSSLALIHPLAGPETEPPAEEPFFTPGGPPTEKAAPSDEEAGPAAEERRPAAAPKKPKRAGTAPGRGADRTRRPARRTTATTPGKAAEGRAGRVGKVSGRPARTHLRDEIAALLEDSGEPMNVRQLCEALGESATKNRLESVRTSAEGLVKAGRAAKAGRGLFAAP
jgi:hypothetical protein